MFVYKCHVCPGSYSETAEHAKRQRKGAEESSRQQRRGARQGRGAGWGPGHGNRAAGQRAEEVELWLTIQWHTER